MTLTIVSEILIPQLYNTQKKRFFLRRIIRTAFSLLFLPRFSSFYKMEIVTFRTSHKLFTIYSDFFHFFLKLFTLKLSNSSASSGILLPLLMGLFTIRLLLFKLIFH
jgi:hypothetical protein